MSEERTNAALGRIDAALARIETIAGQVQSDTELRKLGVRHAALRAEASDAIQALNALIADEEKR